MNRSLPAAFAMVIPVAIAAFAQDRAELPEASFDVASVKVSPDDTAPERIASQPNGVSLTAFHVRTLITIAYRAEGIQRFDQLVGGPSWIATDRFDIVAKVREPDAQGAMQNLLPTMLRTLLRDRFRLRLHSETRDMPAFALVISRRDRQLGPELRESTIDCSASGATSDPSRWCGIRAVGGVITGHAVSTPLLAGNLSGYPAVDRHVTGRTGLTGRYDFRLEYSPAFLQSPDAVQNSGPSLFTALTEQLGLTLQPESVKLPVLVIDNIEKPTPN